MSMFSRDWWPWWCLIVLINSALVSLDQGTDVTMSPKVVCIGANIGAPRTVEAIRLLLDHTQSRDSGLVLMLIFVVSMAELLGSKCNVADVALQASLGSVQTLLVTNYDDYMHTYLGIIPMREIQVEI